MARFKGFSTVDRIKPPFVLTDNELVKRDLLNEFYTKKGERVMRPNFGCIIWDLLMDPMTPDVRELILEDVERIVQRDPRVRLVNMDLFELDHSIRVEVTLNYVEVDQTDVLYLTYLRNNEEEIN